MDKPLDPEIRFVLHARQTDRKTSGALGSWQIRGASRYARLALGARASVIDQASAAMPAMNGSKTASQASDLYQPPTSVLLRRRAIDSPTAEERLVGIQDVVPHDGDRSAFSIQSRLHHLSSGTK